jgi:adenine-specific DNA glycosylase
LQVNFRTKDKHRLKTKGCKKTFHIIGSKKSRIGNILIRKVDFNSKVINRDNECHSMMTKVSIHKKVTIIMNVSVPNLRSPKCIKQTLKELNGEICSKNNNKRLQCPIFNNGQKNRQKVYRKQDLNNTVPTASKRHA